MVMMMAFSKLMNCVSMRRSLQNAIKNVGAAQAELVKIGLMYVGGERFHPSARMHCGLYMLIKLNENLLNELGKTQDKKLKLVV